jgi:hypothetical protein
MEDAKSERDRWLLTVDRLWDHCALSLSKWRFDRLSAQRP